MPRLPPRSAQTVQDKKNSHEKNSENFLETEPHQKEPLIPQSNNQPENKNSFVQEDKNNGNKSGKKGFLAIIIDDIGYNRHTEKMLINTAFPLTLAFLPYGAFTEEEMIEAKKKEKEIMLHQPMQPVDKNYNPGHGALYLSMTHAEIDYVFNNNLKKVNFAKGVNNHMGSGFTQDKDQMQFFLELAKEKDLFFVDSLTHPDSVAYDTAIQIRMPALKRDVFLDATINKHEIKKNLYLAVKLAQKQGKAVAIGHPYPETVEVLLHELPNVDRIINLVFASQLLSASNN